MFVNDTLQALVDLAYAWRSQFNFPVVAITGSVGKTTTKEMVRNILAQTSMNYLASCGNQNTLIGVSLNILKMRATHDVAVFELGIAETGGMKKLAQLLRPTHAAITFVGHGHLQGLGDVADVAAQKRDVFCMLKASGIGIINGDQPELSQISYQHQVIRFGKKRINQIQASKIKVVKNCVSFIAKIYEKKYLVTLPTCNIARVNNALCAMAIGKVLQISDELLIAGVQQSMHVPGRFQILPHAFGCVLIHDAYNANPDSMQASLQAFQAYQTDLKKVLVLGDMMELGEKSDFWHQKLGIMVKKVSDLHSVILIGKQVALTKKTLPADIQSCHFTTIEDAFEQLKCMLLSADKVFLFKASNSLRFSALVKRLQEI